MQRSILHIAIVMTVWVTAHAQVIAPMGKGLPAAPDRISDYKNGIITVYDDRDNNIALSYWNGYFWENYPSPTELKTSEDLRIIDLKTQDETIYLAIGKTGEYYLYKWDGTKWIETTNTVTKNAISLDALFIENSQMKCLGIFTENGTTTNIVSENALNEWTLEGNLITSKTNARAFGTVAQKNGKLVATGRFIDPRSSNITLAEWNGKEWKPASLPPFLGENITLGKYENNIVIYGESAFEPAGFKLEVNDQWTIINEGLDEYDIENVDQFAQLNNQLLALGSFKNKVTNKTENILIFDGEKWSSTSLTINNIERAFTYNNSILISGDFNDNGNLKGIGTIYNDRALVQVRVFEDLNENCLKESNENWLSDYPIELNGNEYLSTNDAGIVYIESDKATLTINAATYDYAKPTCPVNDIVVSEYRNYYGTALGVRYENGVKDISVRLEDVNSNVSKPQEERSALLCVTNEGTQDVSNANISLNLKGATNFFSDITPELRTENTVSWSLDLLRRETRCISINYTLTDPDTSILNAQVSLIAGSEDRNIGDNTAELKYKTGTTSYNHKYCENGTLIGKSSNRLDYKVNFRNNKSHVVKSVIVIDELDKDVSISFKGIHATTSHQDNIDFDIERRTDLNGVKRDVLIIKYNDVNLPSMYTDSVAASGFLDLLINVNERVMVEGLEICNTAQIYFESESGNYYEPILTNEVCSTVGETLSVTGSVPPVIKPKLLVTPNPAQNHLIVDNGDQKDLSIKLINTLGQEVVSVNIASHTDRLIDISSLSSGVYTLYADGLYYQKVIITK